MFSQRLDRVAFVAYFLGAVVPLASLAAMAKGQDVLLEWPLQASGSVFLVSVGCLSLGSFLLLRRITRQAVRRLDDDNVRLAALLNASTALSGSHVASDAAAITARHAVKIAPVRAAFVLRRGTAGQPPQVLECAGTEVQALLAQMGGSVASVAAAVMADGRPAQRRPMEDWQNEPGWIGPPTVAIPLMSADQAIAALVVVHAETDGRFEPAHLDALSTLAGLASMAMAGTDLRDAQQNFFSHVVELLVEALDSHLGHHEGHGYRVAEHANKVGHALGLTQAQLQDLHFGALLHDVGMLKVERELQDDVEARDQHPAIGGNILAQIRLWETCAPLVRHHHEWFDGSGHPDGLRGEAIPVGARIIAACDAFDAMVSATSYQRPVSTPEALARLRRGAGTQFDPRVVEAFCDLVERGVIELEPEEEPVGAGAAY
jgi:hypothetical protein